MRSILLGMLILLTSCAEKDMYDLKYSECMQKTPDYSLLLHAPKHSTDQNGGGSLSLHLSVDSLAEPYKYRGYTSEDPPDMWRDDQEFAKDYYLIQRTFFNCNVTLDTCYLEEEKEGGLYGDISENYIYHKDTLAWPSPGGGWMGGGPFGATLQCQLDSSRSMVLLEPGNRSDYEFVSGVTLLDTVSDPAYRSIYQHWWPLPRKPWPMGESVIADSTVWADSVADSLEVWTYPWRHKYKGEFVKFPL